MPDAAERLRDELREIGERRAFIAAETLKLEADTGKGVKRARGVIGMTEVAELLGLHRTSLYQTYGA